MVSSTLRHFRDPEEFQNFIRGGRARLYVTESGDYRSELVRIDLQHAWMQRFWQSLSTVVHTKVDESRSAILFPADTQQRPITYAGTEIAPTGMISLALGDEHHLRFPSDTKLSACSLSAADLAFFGRTLVGRELQAPRVSHAVRPKAELLSRLRNVHGAAVSLATNTPDILANPEVGKAVEQALIQAAIACLVDTGGIDTTRVSPASSRAIRRLEELLEARQDEPLYIPEICASVGIGERTLRSYCHEHLGMSPQRYLWLRRMNLAQRALVRAEARTTTVTNIATQYGFGELGRFAVSYRALFGESPSVTLNRR